MPGGPVQAARWQPAMEGIEADESGGIAAVLKNPVRRRCFAEL
jgi:hypothetical protein